MTGAGRTDPAVRHPPDWVRLRPALTAAAQMSGDAPAIDPECLSLVRQTGAFRALLPPGLGGPGGEDGGEIDPITVLELVEECGAIRGALGWIAFVGVVGGVFHPQLGMEAAREIYADPDPLIAYAGAPAGKLVREANGFKLSGRWAVVSGLSHATWLALGARVDGTDTTAVAIVPRAACAADFPWEPVGLIGTGTGAATIDRLVVPAGHVVIDDAGHDQRSGRYRTLIPAMIASVSLGIAAGALAALSDDLPAVGPHAPAGPEQVREVTGRAWAQVHAARAFLHQSTTTIWSVACTGRDPGLEAGARLRLAATQAAQVGAEVTSTLVGLVGTAGVTAGHPLCRRWLDARTVTANVTVRSVYYRVYGAVRLTGEAPESWA